MLATAFAVIETPQLVQVTGAMIILAAYVAAQLGWSTTDSWMYLILNLVGSIILGVLAWFETQWGFLLLEGAWALITLWSLIAKSKSKSEHVSDRSEEKPQEQFEKTKTLV